VTGATSEAEAAAAARGLEITARTNPDLLQTTFIFLLFFIFFFLQKQVGRNVPLRFLSSRGGGGGKEKHNKLMMTA